MEGGVQGGEGKREIKNVITGHDGGYFIMVEQSNDNNGI